MPDQRAGRGQHPHPPPKTLQPSILASIFYLCGNVMRGFIHPARFSHGFPLGTRFLRDLDSVRLPVSRACRQAANYEQSGWRRGGTRRRRRWHHAIRKGISRRVLSQNGRNRGEYWLFKSDHFHVDLQPISETFTGGITARVSDAGVGLQPELSLEELVRQTKPAVVY